MKVGLGSGTAAGSESAPPSRDQRTSTRFVAPEPGQLALLFPQLEILELIGQGGMGAVYKARQKALDRLVALKILPADIGVEPAFAERFNREARTLARLTHTNIVAVHDFGQAGRYCFFLMEFIDGVTLRHLLVQQKLAAPEALAIVPQICEALQFAHSQGVVHRDIKPENILLDKSGRVKIADFGLAKLVGTDSPGQRLTQPRDVMGTPHYMAPEQIEHPLEVDHRADIYSLGVVFYEMLTGELPLGKFAAPSQKVQVDVRLDEVVLKALEKEPERRYQQASQVKTEVETIAAGPHQAESVASGDAMSSAEIRRRLRVPALGLLITSLSGPFMLGFLVEIGRLKAGAWMFWPLVIELALTALAAYGALKALRLESYRSALAGGIAGCVVSFLNFLCLPFAVWLLAVLTRPSVKRAFLLNLAGDAGRKLPSPQPVRRPRQPGTAAQAGVAFKRWFVPVAGALLFLLILLGASWGSVLLFRNSSFSGNQNPPSDEQVLLDRSAAYRLPGSGPDEVADLSNRLVTQQDLEALAAKPRLKRLHLQDSSINDGDLEFISGLKELEWLDISATLGATPYKPWITDAGLTHLASLKRLRSLFLHGNPIADGGLEHLKSLPSLEKLQLGGTRVTGDGLRHLPGLKWLRLDATPITDEGLRHLQAMGQLEQLYLDGTAISDKGLSFLTGLTKLRVLNVHSTKVTAAGIASLKNHLPAVAVGVDDELETPLASAPGKRSAAALASGFLPTREVSFGRRDLLQDCFLVLESGRLLSAPKELTDRLATQNKWRPGQRVQLFGIVDWLRSNRVDLVARTGIDGLTMVDGMGVLTATRASGVGALDSAEASQVAQLSDAMAETLGVHTNQQTLGMGMYWFDPRGAENTWIIRNREGRAGLLEIVESGGELGRMKIRYKLLDPGASVLRSPRETVAEWLRLIRSARTEEAWGLTTRSSSAGWGPSLTELWQLDRVRPTHQLGNSEQAMVVSSPFQDNAGATCVFYAVLNNLDGRWLIDRHGRTSAKDASRLMQGFKIHPGVKFDVVAEELVGEWRAPCLSLTLTADGKGVHVQTGPGSVEKSDSLQWEVSGSTLLTGWPKGETRWDVIWVDDDSFQVDYSPGDATGHSWTWQRFGSVPVLP